MRQHIRSQAALLGLTAALLLMIPAAGAGEAEMPLPVLSVPLQISDPGRPEKGSGWSWDSTSRTLSLEDGLTIRTEDSCMNLPEGATVKVLGTVTLFCEEEPEEETTEPTEGMEESTAPIPAEEEELPTALDLGGKGELVLSQGAVLKVCSRGDGIRGGDVALNGGTLELETARDGLLVRSLTLGEDARAVFSCGGIGIRAAGNKGVSIAGTAVITAAKGGILATATGKEDRVTLFADSVVEVRSGEHGTVGIDSGGNVTALGSLTVVSGGIGIRTGSGKELAAEGTLSVTAGVGPALAVGGDLKLQGASVTVTNSGANGVTTGGDVNLVSAALTVEQAAGHGLRVSGTVSLDGESAIDVRRSGESGVTADGLLTVDGTLTVGEARGDGLVSLKAGLRLAGDATIKAQGGGVSCALGVTCADTASLTVDAGGDGVVSRTGSVLLAVRPEAEAKITAKGTGIWAGEKAELCQPGVLTVSAGDIGVWAAGDVSVGGVEGARCDLSITCGSNSIWSEGGNVSLRACSDCYFFDGSIHVNSAIGKTLSVLEGAGLIFGMREGFAVGILRKDYTITSEKAAGLLVLRTLQVGQGHTVTVAAGAQVKVGPLVLGRNAHFFCADGSKVYYNGPVTQVTGQVQPYITITQEFTTGKPVQSELAEWDGQTLTLRGAIVDVPEGPALRLPPGSVLRLEGTSYLSSGGGSVVSCEGDLTVEGGRLVLSGGATGLQVSGALTLNGAVVGINGAEGAAISAGAVYASRSSLDLQGGQTICARGDIAIDSLPEDVKVISQGGWSILQRDGQGLTQLALSGAGPTADHVTTAILTTPDGTRIETATDQLTGVVTQTMTAPGGAVTVRQTRPDGVESMVTALPGERPTAQITLPEGVEQAIVSLPVPGTGMDTVPALLLPDGGTRVLPLSSCSLGRAVLLAEGSMQVVFLDGSKEFIDVSKESWYYAPVAFVAGRDLFRGVGGGRFDPSGTATCGMIATVLHRLCGGEEYTAPLDQAQPFDSDAVTWAVSTGVVSGQEDGFVPGADITRQQLAAMLYRCAELMGLDTEPSAALSRFGDGDTAAPWAAEGLRWAVAQDILKGQDNGMLAPAGTATRAEVAAMLQRFVLLALG